MPLYDTSELLLSVTRHVSPHDLDMIVREMGCSTHLDLILYEHRHMPI
jgi:hypothetical protein